MEELLENIAAVVQEEAQMEMGRESSEEDSDEEQIDV